MQVRKPVRCLKHIFFPDALSTFNSISAREMWRLLEPAEPMLEAPIIPTYNSHYAKTNCLPSDLLTPNPKEIIMRPRNFSARIGVIFCVVILSLVSIDFTDRAVATQAGLLAYCDSSPDQSDIYISQIFN